jgi:hypothetical protein
LDEEMEKNKSMRNREDLLSEALWNNNWQTGPGAKVTLEVLLDIRDLLKKIQEDGIGGI